MVMETSDAAMLFVMEAGHQCAILVLNKSKFVEVTYNATNE